MIPVLRETLARLLAALLPRGGSERLLALFVAASMPATLIACWHAGVAPESADGITGWQADWRQLGSGLAQLGPPLVVALVTGFAWERLFAIQRDRRADAGWFMVAWLYTLLLPPGLPLALVALGMSFGAVFGMHVFGGTGRYVASPAVVGALFLYVAYPDRIGEALAWTTIVPNAVTDASSPGFVAAAFFVTCAAGAFTLVAAGAASARTLTGALAGLLVVSLPLAITQGLLVPLQHATTGAFAFGWAFLLTDPTTQAVTRAGRWVHGAVFAALVVLVREADPGRPDGVLVAVLVAGLTVPLADWLVLAVQHRRRGPALELRS